MFLVLRVSILCGTGMQADISLAVHWYKEFLGISILLSTIKSNMAQSEVRQKHLVLIAANGYGHVIPAICLARKLSMYQKVTFAICKASLQHIRQKGELTIDDEKVIDIVGLEDGIPLGSSEEVIADIAWKKAIEVTMPSVVRFIQVLPKTSNDLAIETKLYNVIVPVDAVIRDAFLAKPLSTCAKRNIPLYIFSCSAAGPFRTFLYMTENTPVSTINELESFMVLRPESEELQPAVDLLMKEFGLSMNQNLAAVRGCLFNSFREMDKNALQELKQDLRMKHIDFYCIGPLMPEEKVNFNVSRLAVQNEVSN